MKSIRTEQRLRNAAENSKSRMPLKEQDKGLQERLAVKEEWKKQPGNHYTPEELQRMAESSRVTIYRRKRRVVRI